AFICSRSEQAEIRCRQEAWHIQSLTREPDISFQPSRPHKRFELRFHAFVPPHPQYQPGTWKLTRHVSQALNQSPMTLVAMEVGYSDCNKVIRTESERPSRLTTIE